MKIGVFGLGYVGVVSAALLARHGHRVVGVDTNPMKVNMINAGKSPIAEQGLPEIVAAGRSAGLLRASLNPKAAVDDADVILICVGTPSWDDGSLDMTALQRVILDIASAVSVRKWKNPPTVAIRSTVEPGTTHRMRRLFEQSGVVPGKDVYLVHNPEFMREGSAVSDFEKPPYTIIGADNSVEAETLRRLYDYIEAPLIVTSVLTSEMVKMVNNAFHALKVTFANEIGVLAKALGVDGREVMHLVCRDTKLNISPAYLRPGFAFGGSCLPKDLRAINALATMKKLQLPLLSAIGLSNERHIERAIRWLEAHGRQSVGFVGLAFKGGTDDLRESPIIRVIEWAIGRGYPVGIYDPWVQPERLTGTNKEYMDRHLPHIQTRLFTDLVELLGRSELLVIAAPLADNIGDLLRGFDGHVLDLVDNHFRDDIPHYEGICW